MIIMNTRIFSLITDQLHQAFDLPRYQALRDGRPRRPGHDVLSDPDTRMEFLPWTPARQQKFQRRILDQLDLDDQDFQGTIAEICQRLDRQYMARFFGEIWKPKTDDYQYSGWSLVDEINQQDPQAVLDVGCGYNQFRGRIRNLRGIDPYNNNADYMVSVEEYRVPERHDHVLALGSMNFGTAEDVEQGLRACRDLLAPGGRLYVRANPGRPWRHGPWVDIFPWNFEFARGCADRLGLEITTFKKDNHERFYIVYELSA